MYEFCDLSGGIVRVGRCLQVLEERASIRELNCRLPLSLNGPEGSVLAKTVESMKLLKWGSERMKQNLDLQGYDDTSLLRCMALHVEMCPNLEAQQKRLIIT